MPMIHLKIENGSYCVSDLREEDDIHIFMSRGWVQKKIAEAVKEGHTVTIRLTTLMK